MNILLSSCRHSTYTSNHPYSEATVFSNAYMRSTIITYIDILATACVLCIVKLQVRSDCQYHVSMTNVEVKKEPLSYNI